MAKAAPLLAPVACHLLGLGVFGLRELGRYSVWRDGGDGPHDAAGLWRCDRRRTARNAGWFLVDVTQPRSAYCRRSFDLGPGSQALKIKLAQLKKCAAP